MLLCRCYQYLFFLLMLFFTKWSLHFEFMAHNVTVIRYPLIVAAIYSSIEIVGCKSYIVLRTYEFCIVHALSVYQQLPNDGIPFPTFNERPLSIDYLFGCEEDFTYWCDNISVNVTVYPKCSVGWLVGWLLLWYVFAYTK